MARALQRRAAPLRRGRAERPLRRLPDLTPAGYVDPVHFNEDGNRVVAEAFAAPSAPARARR